MYNRSLYDSFSVECNNLFIGIMTKFEQYLLSVGYLKFLLNGKTMRYQSTTDDLISTMGNINYRYFHESDKNILDKIYSNKSVMDSDFTYVDRSGEIIFGLNEVGKPVTLCSPRPNMEIKRIVNSNIVFEYHGDDNMNVVLSQIKHDLILLAMFNKSIILKVDLTK